MNPLTRFKQSLNSSETRIFKSLSSPEKIQTFLDDLPYSSDSFYRCPLRVMQDRVGHCFDGGIFAAAALRVIGWKALIIDMLPNSRDDDHLLAIFKRDGCWGAVAKSNFVGLRFREPIHRTLRELVISYFEQYYNVAREKTLRSYTRPLNLSTFDKLHWMTEDGPLDMIADRLDTLRPIPVLSRRMIAHLSAVDERSYKAGMIGVNEAGLFRPTET